MSLPEVLQFLGMGKMTGALTIVHGDYAATLVLRQGRLINSSSLGRSRRLGQMLINRGLIERSAVEEALAYQQDFSPGTPLGRILVHRGYLTMDQLRQAIRLQLEEELWDLFSLREGSFKFEHGDEATIGSDSVVELEIEPLILEGTRRQDEWSRIVRNIPSDSAIPYVVSLSDPEDRELLQLSSSEWQVLSLINGDYDMGCIANRGGIGKFETFRVINSFLASGLVKVMMPTEPVPARVPLEESAESFSAAKNGNGSASSEERTPPGLGSSARLASLFTRWRESDSSGNLMPPPDSDAPTTRPRGQLSFVSPVSFVVATCNAVLGELMRQPDFVIDPRDERIGERYWRQIVMDFPKADLVWAEGNLLKAERFDRYIESVGVDGPMRGIYTDTMEALSRYLRTCYMLAAQRLGTKVARRTFASLLEDFRQRSKVLNAEDFFFNEYATRALA
ncbi:MAG: DUF4388 domain-containing protein [Candidatus Sumerlaeaceae bacterium]